MKTIATINPSEVSLYKRIEFLITQSDIEVDEDEGKLSYKNKTYLLEAWLSGEHFEYIFEINDEPVELEQEEQELIFEALRKEIDSERSYACLQDMTDTYNHINSNFYSQY